MLTLLGWTTKPRDSWYTSSDVFREPYVTELVGRWGSSFCKAKQVTERNVGFMLSVVHMQPFFVSYFRLRRRSTRSKINKTKNLPLVLTMCLYFTELSLIPR